LSAKAEIGIAPITIPHKVNENAPPTIRVIMMILPFTDCVVDQKNGRKRFGRA
jgi:hypothetical protein